MRATFWRYIMLAGSHVNRFWTKVSILAGDNPCWIWTSSKINSGYGQFRLNRQGYLAHRLSYEYCIGPIPIGLEIDHLCRSRACVNPFHLEPVTHSVNALRGLVGKHGFNSGKTHCLLGHEYSLENTYLIPGKNQRQCRTCKRIADEKYRKSIKATR